jgi:hypothetical protein
MAELANASGRKSGALKTGNTGTLISSYYLEIEYLIERVAGSSTYYQTLGLEQAADNQAIVHAYQQAVKLLHHPNRKVRAALPEDMQQRIDQAFNKISEAFVILTDGSKRNEYDRSLTRRNDGCRAGSSPSGTGSNPPPTGSNPQTTGSNSPAVSGEPHELSDSGRIKRAAKGRTSERVRIVDSAVAVQPPRVNRRRADRIQLAIPTLVIGHDRTDGKWKEIVKTMDVSRNGAALLMNRRVKHGLLLHLRLPMPAKLRCHGFAEPGYKVYAIVRRIELPVDATRVVGVEFLGEQAPPGFLAEPWREFRSKAWNGPDRRREPRQKRSDRVWVDYLDDSMSTIKREQAIMEDVSLSGMRLALKAGAPDVSLVKVTTNDDSFTSLAGVRNRFVDDDGREKLCLKLISNTWSL